MDHSLDLRRPKQPLQLDRLIIGCSGLAGIYQEIDEALAVDAVSRAIELGCTLFDTAPHYGLGLSEERLGKALAEVEPERRKSLKLFTKVGRVLYESTESVPSGAEVDTANIAGAPTCIFPATPQNRVPVLDYR